MELLSLQGREVIGDSERKSESEKQRPLSAQVLMCGIPLRFPLLAVAMVKWLAALVALAAGRGVLLARRALVLAVLFGLGKHKHTP